MTFQELSTHIKARHRKDYAKLLIAHTDAIIMEVGRTSKGDTARALDITPNAFSLVYQIILAHKEVLTNETTN